MKQLAIGICAISTVFCSCHRLNIEPGTPDCVQAKIARFDREPGCADIKVDEYRFHNKAVYAFEPGSCGADITTEIIDADCNTLGYLGGIDGGGQIEGDNFSSATFIRTVWAR